MASQPNDLPITSLRGGLNTTDPPQDILPDECVQAENVEFFFSALGERRLGCAPLDLTGSNVTNESTVGHLSQWYPTNAVTVPEYVVIGVTPGVSVTVARGVPTAWHNPSITDTPSNSVPDAYSVVAQPLDANDFIAYHSSQDRLHVLDNSGNWRRAGLAQPNVPTVADNPAAGNFTGVRYYRVRYIVVSGSAVLRRSEPSNSVTFTPSGTHNAAQITKPATISEGETHWELEASADNATWFHIPESTGLTQIPVATTSVLDYTASSKSYPAVSHAAPTSNDGTSITYVLLSDQAAALNLTGTVSNGSYGNPAGVIYGRGWLGYDSGGTYIPSFPSTWTAGQNWYASPDVATALEAAASGNSANYAAIGTVSDAVGAYLNIPSAKYLVVDGDRLIYAGHWTNAALMSQVGWTPVRNDPGVGNSERAPIVTTGGGNLATTVDLDNYDGGALTGIAASTFGTWYAFKWQRIYSAVRTGNVEAAYDINTVSTTRGAIQGSIIKAADNSGSANIFFLDPFVGPCKLSNGGIVTPIHGLRGLWKRINLKASNVVCCGAYYPYKQQVKWWISVDGGNTPTLGITVQVSELQYRAQHGSSQLTNEIGRGISTTTGLQGTALCAAALTYTVGNVTTDIPFIGLSSPNYVQRCDTGSTDNSTPFVATITAKPMFVAGLLNKFAVRMGGFLATSDPVGSVIINLLRDEGVEVFQHGPLSLAPSPNNEPQVIIPIDDLRISDCRSVQVQITDGSPVSNWQVQRIDLKPTISERG